MNEQKRKKWTAAEKLWIVLPSVPLVASNSRSRYIGGVAYDGL
jgi:hypothetical protein